MLLIEILEKIANKFQNTINVAGKIKLTDELNLISNLDIANKYKSLYKRKWKNE